MFLPCETFVKKYLPAIRMETAKQLIGSHQFTQTEVSSALGVTQAAISKGLHNNFEKELSKETLKEIKSFAKLFSENISTNKPTSFELNFLCKNCHKCSDYTACFINNPGLAPPIIQR